MNELLGLGMLYLWIHTGIIVFKKTQGTTGYERFVLIGGAVALILLIVGIALISTNN